MEIQSSNTSPGHNADNWCLYSFDTEHIQVASYQSSYQAEVSLGQPGLGGLRKESLPVHRSQSPGENALCVFNRTTTGDGFSALFPTDYITTVPTDSGKEETFFDESTWEFLENKGKCEKRDIIGRYWTAKKSLGTPLSGTKNTFNSSHYDNFISTPYHRIRNQDWIANQLPNCLDRNKFADGTTRIAAAKHQTSHPAYHQSTNAEHEDTQTVIWPSEELPMPSTQSLESAVGFSSPFNLGTSSIAMAHQAVADLFPELAGTCGPIEAKKAPRYEEVSGTGSSTAPGIHETKILTPPSHPSESDCRSIKLKHRGRSITDLYKRRFRSKPSRSSSAIGLPSSGAKAGPSKCRNKQTPTNQQTTPPLVLCTTSRESPEAEQISQLSSELVKLDLKIPNYPVAEGNVSSLTTVSPQQLSKNYSPSPLPEHSFFCSEEGNYRNITHEVFDEEPIITRSEDGDEDMPDVLSIKSKFKALELEGSESSFSLLSPTESSAPPSPGNSLPLTIPVSDLDLSDPMSPRHKNAPQSSTTEEPNCSLRRKPTPKGVSRSKMAKKSSKELMSEQNQLLLRWRAQGISYKIIKERLGIDEAESTLRGRLRTLTKPKSERLRRPQWIEKDIMLLLEVVTPEIVNVKWKQVSESIVKLGGSYRFGPSTCKKQYMKLVASGRARPLAEGTVGKRSTVKSEIGNLRLSTRNPCRNSELSILP